MPYEAYFASFLSGSLLHGIQYLISSYLHIYNRIKIGPYDVKSQDPGGKKMKAKMYYFSFSFSSIFSLLT